MSQIFQERWTWGVVLDHDIDRRLVGELFYQWTPVPRMQAIELFGDRALAHASITFETTPLFVRIYPMALLEREVEAGRLEWDQVLVMVRKRKNADFLDVPTFLGGVAAQRLEGKQVRV